MGLIKKIKQYFEDKRFNEIESIVRRELETSTYVSDDFKIVSILESYFDLESKTKDFTWSVVSNIASLYGKYFDVVNESDYRIFSDKQRIEIDKTINRIIASGTSAENLKPSFLRTISGIDILNSRKYDFDRLDDIIKNAYGMLDEFIVQLPVVNNGKSTKDTAAALKLMHEEILNNPIYQILSKDKKYKDSYFTPNIQKIQ